MFKKGKPIGKPTVSNLKDDFILRRFIVAV